MVVLQNSSSRSTKSSISTFCSSSVVILVILVLVVDTIMYTVLYRVTHFILLAYDTVSVALMMCVCTTINEHLQYNEVLHITKTCLTYSTSMQSHLMA